MYGYPRRVRPRVRHERGDRVGDGQLPIRRLWISRHGGRRHSGEPRPQRSGIDYGTCHEDFSEYLGGPKHFCTSIQGDQVGLRLNLVDINSGVLPLCSLVQQSLHNFSYIQSELGRQRNKPDQSQLKFVSNQHGHPVSTRDVLMFTTASGPKVDQGKH